MLAILFGLICVGVGIYFWWNNRSLPPFDGQTVSGKRVLVTGCATGLGKATAFAYAKHGARLIITDICGEPLVEVGRRCESHGAKQVITFAADLTLAADQQRLLAAVDRHFDGGLDQLILVHCNAAKFALWRASCEDLTYLRRSLQVNFVSFVELASSAFKMLEKSDGRICVVSSMSGKVATALLSSYSSTKHAVQGFFSSWRHELEVSKSKVSITICTLALIGTESALRDINRGHVRTVATDAASPAEAAERILRGVCRRERDVYFPFRARLAIEVHKIFPGLIEKIVGSHLKE